MSAQQGQIEGIVAVGQPPSTVASGWLRLALIVGLLALLGSLYAAGLERYLDWDAMRGRVGEWRELTKHNLLAAMMVCFAVYVAMTSLSLPVSAAMSILCGALFDRWIGACLASLSATVGAALAFVAARYLLHDWVRHRFGHRLQAIDRGVHRDGAFYLFGLRLTPAPFALVNLGMALTPMRLGAFVFVSWVGMLLPCFLYANAGSNLARIARPSDALSPEVVVSLALLGLSPLVLRLLQQFRRA